MGLDLYLSNSFHIIIVILGALFKNLTNLHLSIETRYAT